MDIKKSFRFWTLDFMIHVQFHEQSMNESKTIISWYQQCLFQYLNSCLNLLIFYSFNACSGILTARYTPLHFLNRICTKLTFYLVLLTFLLARSFKCLSGGWLGRVTPTCWIIFCAVQIWKRLKLNIQCQVISPRSQIEKYIKYLLHIQCKPWVTFLEYKCRWTRK